MNNLHSYSSAAPEGAISLKSMNSAARRDFVEESIEKGLPSTVKAIIQITNGLVLEGEASPELLAKVKIALGSPDQKNVADMLRLSELRGAVRSTGQGLLDYPDQELAMAKAAGMLRYAAEDGSYIGDTTPLDVLKEKGLIRRGDPLIDLGAGSGTIVDDWGNEGNPSVGFDVSPSFVAAHERLHFGVIDGSVELLRSDIEELLKYDNPVINSSLTLDRVGNPNQLIRNMSELAGEKGTVFLGTLLPLNPVDDDKNVKKRINYTPHNYQMKQTETVEGDVKMIKEFLGDTHKAVVEVFQRIYRVRTMTDMKEYPDYYMFHAKRNAVAPLRRKSA